MGLRNWFGSPKLTTPSGDEATEAAIKLENQRTPSANGSSFITRPARDCRGQAFYCSALHGQSDYNITINSDLTVSCNCQDYDSSGHLGDLKQESFDQVFFGPVAQGFRETLIRGKMPIMTCTRCGDLRRIARSKIPADFPKSTAGNADLPAVRLPYRGMLLENTVSCNIDCLGCDRQSAAKTRSQRQMPLDQIAKMADLVHDLGLQQLFYLNLGEPFLSPNIGKELPLLRAKNPNCRIVISTNGIILNSDVKREAAPLSASFICSFPSPASTTRC